MRIAMFTNNYKPFIGGVPISIERLSKGLIELGHEVYIFAPSYDENMYGVNSDEEENVIRYKSLRNKKLKGGIVIPNMFDLDIEKYFKELKIDVIHAHHPMLVGNTAQYLSKKYNVPLIFTYHTRYEQYLHNIKAYEILENRQNKSSSSPLLKAEGKLLEYTQEKLVPGYIKLFSNSCDLVFSPTNLIKDYLEETGVKSKIKVMPTGLDESYFKENEEVNEKVKFIREKYKGDKKYLFCTVSRLTKEKNLDFMIKGLNELKEKIDDNFRLMIIGKGPYKRELEENINELGLQNNVVFLNSIDNTVITNYYRASDLFLFSSKSETQGIVLLEAMAARVPVVALKASGVIEVVKNGENGFMTEEDTLKWSLKIKEILENEELFKVLKQGAYDTALKYMASNIAKEVEETYNFLVYKKKEYSGYKETFRNYMSLSTILKKVNLKA